MSQRSRLAQQMEEQNLVCERQRDQNNEREFEHIFDRKWDVSMAILGEEATSIADLRAQIAVLAQRAADDLADLGIAKPLRRLAGLT